MSWKRWGVLLILGGVFLLRCVAPVYEQAIIEPGTYYTAGVGVHSFSAAAYDAYLYAIGPRGDVCIHRGFNRWLQGSARTALGVGIEVYDRRFIPFLDLALGLKVAPPIRYFHPAVKIEAGFFNFGPALSSTFLLGIEGPSQTEIVTLGIRSYLLPIGYYHYKGLPYTDALASVHLPKGGTIFVGTNIQVLIDEITFSKLDPEYHPDPVISVGFGWTFGPKK
jgi:hypothetical protein